MRLIAPARLGLFSRASRQFQLGFIPPTANSGGTPLRHEAIYLNQSPKHGSEGFRGTALGRGDIYAECTSYSVHSLVGERLAVRELWRVVFGCRIWNLN